MTDVLGDFTVHGRAYLRDTDGSGRFRAGVEKGAEAATTEMANALASLVRGAIEGSGIINRTDALIQSVGTRPVGRARTDVEVTSGHAAPLEKGARDHFIPNAFGSGVAVLWKGSGKSKTGYHFVATAVRAFHGVAGEIVRKNMP